MTQEEEDKLNQSTESMQYQNDKEHELLESSDDSAIEEGRATRAMPPMRPQI